MKFSVTPREQVAGLAAACANREAMASLTAQRTLVKSPPELWTELSEVDRLAKHLEAFGEITITKLEPEHTVAWEGEHACGTVSLEPAGWGTKVTFEAALALEPVPEPPWRSRWRSSRSPSPRSRSLSLSLSLSQPKRTAPHVVAFGPACSEAGSCPRSV